MSSAPHISAKDAIFDAISLQGTMHKEDYSDLCSQLIDKVASISFLSCQVDFNRTLLPESLDKLTVMQARGDTELLNLSNLLNRAISLKRFDYVGITSFN